jgi:hypothetical protein
MQTAWQIARPPNILRRLFAIPLLRKEVLLPDIRKLESNMKVHKSLNQTIEEIVHESKVVQYITGCDHVGCYRCAKRGRSTIHLAGGIAGTG